MLQKIYNYIIPPVGRDPKTLSKEVLVLFILVLAPNILMLALGEFFYTRRALFVLDYFLIAALFPWIGQRGLVVGFTLLFIVDLVQSLSLGFHFKPEGLVESLSFLGILDTGSVILFISGPIILAVILFFLFKFSVRNLNRAIGANIIILLLGGATYLADDNFSPNNSRRDDIPLTNVNIASSSLKAVWDGFLFYNKDDKVPTAYNITSATGELFEYIENDKILPPQIVLVNIEAMSFFKDNAGNILQLAALNNAALQERYEVTIGTVPFSGPTVSGEFRELCRVNIQTVVPDVTLIPADICLPKILAEKGYYSIALHGFHGQFFERLRWHREIAFDESLFIPEIDKEIGKQERCGTTFRSICDTHILPLIHKMLLGGEQERLFLYWLTVSGHLPIDFPDTIKIKSDCTASKDTQEVAALCRSVAINDLVLRGIVDIAMDKDIPETIFILVGDHMAPFLKKDIRDRLDDKNVPFAILYPRSASRSIHLSADQ